MQYCSLGFSENLIELCKNEAAKCADVKKLALVIDVFARSKLTSLFDIKVPIASAGCSKRRRTRARWHCGSCRCCCATDFRAYAHLNHHLDSNASVTSQVRKAAGEKLFMACQMHDELCSDEEQMEAAKSLLADTNWFVMCKT